MKDIEDEIPFEVPEGWAWCRFSDCSINRDSERKPVSAKDRKNIEKNYDYYGATGVVDKIDKYLFDEKLLLIGEDGANLLSRVKNNAFIARGKFWVNNHAHVIDAIEKDILEYLKTYINSLQLDDVITGSAQPKFTQAALNGLLIPLPPLEEQKQIISKIEEIFAQIDSLETGKADLQTAIKHAKSKILGLAIHGKLVPQDSSEEPASKLLEKIRTEKEAKIAAGELKRDKNDSYIYKNPSDNCHYRKYVNGQEESIESEIAFSLPKSWQWVNLGYIFAHNTGKALNKSKMEGKYQDYITTSNVYWDRFELNNVSKMLFTDEELKKCTITKGDLLICEGGDVGRANIWDKDYDICIQNHLHRLRAYVPIETKLFYYWLMLFKQRNMIVGKGIGLMGFSSSLVHNLLIPLPPLSEQKRIVSKIEEIYRFLDVITENLV